jgi:hypothetical protein
MGSVNDAAIEELLDQIRTDLQQGNIIGLLGLSHDDSERLYILSEETRARNFPFNSVQAVVAEKSFEKKLLRLDDGSLKWCHHPYYWNYEDEIFPT